MLLDVYSYIMDMYMVTIYPIKSPIIILMKGCVVTMVLITNKENYGSIDFTDLGKNITEIREDRGLTQEELSEIIGVSRKTISNWETANKKPRLQDLLKLCDALSCDLDYLLGRSLYSTKEIETACKYTGLSEQSAKTLHQFNKSKEVMNIPEFLSDLLDNYENFHFLLFVLEDFLVASYNTKKASEQERKKSEFRDPLLWKKYYDKSSVALLQCQRAIDSLTDEIENDEYIKRIAEIRKAGYAAIIKEKEQ